MTKEELITKQQLQIEMYKIAMQQNEEIVKDLMSKFYSIGQPLNDNALQFNMQQIKWCFGVFALIDNINYETEE